MSFFKRAPAMRTRTVLLAAMTLIVMCTTASGLLIVRWQMGLRIQSDLSTRLSRSVLSFHHLRAEQLMTQQRTGILLADLPSLKALLTTHDPRTIQNEAINLWRTSGSDFFALSAEDGTLMAAYAQGALTSSLSASLTELLLHPAQHEVIDGGRLFEINVRPLYFGSQDAGTLLGYVFTGSVVDKPFVDRLSDESSVGVSFAAGRQVLASSLPAPLQQELAAMAARRQPAASRPQQIQLGGMPYLAMVEELSSTGGTPLQLVLTRSLAETEEATRRMNQLLLLSGVAAVVAGAALMTLLARSVTKPLENLVSEVNTFGQNRPSPLPAAGGTAEVRELHSAFRRMGDRVTQTTAALLQAERLATIGRMADSVSHDLRHYLASVYANAEFLAAPGISDKEREELYGDIRSAVLGTTELIDSLLIFSKAGSKHGRRPARVTEVAHQAQRLVEAHPDALDVSFTTKIKGDEAAFILIDARQVERAMVNLLLNACQADRDKGVQSLVDLDIEIRSGTVSFSITDNGVGVPAIVRDSLFEPFVSEGKQKGTGLGLTLVRSVAQEHGGSILLQCSEAGRTTFVLTLPRADLSVQVLDATLAGLRGGSR